MANQERNSTYRCITPSKMLYFLPACAMGQRHPQGRLHARKRATGPERNHSRHPASARQRILVFSSDAPVRWKDLATSYSAIAYWISRGKPAKQRFDDGIAVVSGKF